MSNKEENKDAGWSANFISAKKSDSVLIIRGKSVLKEKVTPGFPPVKANGVFLSLEKSSDYNNISFVFS